MNVSCPECRSVFRIDPAKITSISMRARCSVCGGIIAVGASVRWEDDLPNATRPSPGSMGMREPVGAGAAASAPPMSSTPAGVKPVLARTPVPPPMQQPQASPSAPAPQAPQAPRPAEPAVIAHPPRRSWGTPVSVPRVSSAAPPVAAPAARPGTSDKVGRGANPQQGANAGAERADPGRTGPAQPAPAESPPARGAPAFGAPLTPPARTTIPAPVEQSSKPAAAPPAPFPPKADAAAAFSTPSTPASPPAAVPSQRRPINPFLANDPNQKARRLARALVSDMVAYNPSKREEGVANGTLKQLFRDEIKKSYEEYVEQVGRDFAETTAHFQEALNDVLSGGRKIF